MATRNFGAEWRGGNGACGITASGGLGGVLNTSGVDLDVFQGELLMLMGPSGCGKTTLLSVIAGILDQDAGECVVLGERLSDLDANAKAAFRCRAGGADHAGIGGDLGAL